MIAPLVVPLLVVAALVGSTPAGPNWLDHDQRRRADQLVSAFENSTTALQYGYAENLGDGRGVTAGRAGFASATCDALAVIEVYTDDVGNNVLSPFVPELGQLCDDESDETGRLPQDDYIAAWAAAANDPAFRAAQDAIVDRDYYVPAMEAADDLGLETALARAELFDTSLQHGPGDDPDGLYTLIERTNDATGTPAEVGERAWLDGFFDARIDDLTNPADAATTEDWRQSTDRVECMRRIAASGNYDLAGPLTFSVYGDEFTIE